jgi:hypothetical protein
MGKPKYDYVNSIQEAINMAVAEKRVVRFISRWTDDEIRAMKEIDRKGCKLRKPDRASNDIAVIPKGHENFDFDAVDTKIVIPKLDRDLKTWRA